jgi:hypothetical protein
MNVITGSSVGRNSERGSGLNSPVLLASAFGARKLTRGAIGIARTRGAYSRRPRARECVCARAREVVIDGAVVNGSIFATVEDFISGREYAVDASANSRDVYEESWKRWVAGVCAPAATSAVASSTAKKMAAASGCARKPPVNKITLVSANANGSAASAVRLTAQRRRKRECTRRNLRHEYQRRRDREGAASAGRR